MDLDFSAGSLFTSLIVSSVGLALFLYGKKQDRTPQLVAGLVLMVFPYFVPGVWEMIGVSVGILFVMWLVLRRGD